MLRRLASVGVRVLPFAIAAVAMAGLVHIGTILAYPGRARDDAYARVAALGPAGARIALPGADRGRLPSRDPAMVSAVCRYDLATGPFRIAIGAFDEGFLSLGLHSRHGIPFYGLNIRAGESGPLDLVVMTDQQKAESEAGAAEAGRHVLQIVAPEPEGFVVIDTPADGPAAGQAVLDDVTCGGPVPRGGP